MKRIRGKKFRGGFEKGKFRTEEDILLYGLKKRVETQKKREIIRKLLR